MKYYNTEDWLRLAAIARDADAIIQQRSTGKKAKHFKKAGKLEAAFQAELMNFGFGKITIEEVETLYARAAAKTRVGYTALTKGYTAMLEQARWEGVM